MWRNTYMRQSLIPSMPGGTWGSLCSCPAKHIHVLSALSPGWIEGLQRLSRTSNWNTPNYLQNGLSTWRQRVNCSVCVEFYLVQKVQHPLLHSVRSSVSLPVFWIMLILLTGWNQSIMAEALSLFCMFRKNWWSRQERAPNSCCAKGCTVSLIFADFWFS